MLTVVWDCVVVHSENMEPTMQRCCVYIYIYIYIYDSTGDEEIFYGFRGRISTR